MTTRKSVALTEVSICAQKLIISTFKMQVVPLLDSIAIGSIQHVAHFQNRLCVSLSNAFALAEFGKIPTVTKAPAQL